MVRKLAPRKSPIVPPASAEKNKKYIIEFDYLKQLDFTFGLK
jgi:hypothetical protein